MLEPLDFIARLAAPVPPPRVHLTKFHGVFAAHAALRAAITPGGKGAGSAKRAAEAQRPALKAVRMTWARRLKRVFWIEIEQCARCGADGTARSAGAAAGGAVLILLWVRTFDTVEELRGALLDWAELYKERWMIQRHGYISPAQRRREHYAATEQRAA